MDEAENGAPGRNGEAEDSGEADDIPEDVLSRFPSTLRLLHLARMVFIEKLTLEEAAAVSGEEGEGPPTWDQPV